MRTNDNPAILAPTPDIILQELRFENYLPAGQELEDIKKGVHSALTKMIEEPTNYRGHIEKAKQFLKVLWRKYDCKNIVEVFEAFIKIEPVLIDMERDEGVGFRYRDHSVHTFHVFIFGLRIISKLIDRVGDKQVAKLLKVKPERIHKFIPSSRDYDYKERLFYLWSLMSTFHDIAVPLEHLDIIRNGLNKFSEQFDLDIEGPYLQRDLLVAGIDSYFALLSRIFQGKVSLDNEGVCYKQDKENLYVKNILAGEFVSNDHGVLGGYMMYKTIEKTFLWGTSPKHTFNDMNLFNSYARYVLSQDIARAALAISLHNLKRIPQSEGPLFLPLRFDEYPLAFILILSDGIQEYLRWEGSSKQGGTKFSSFPALELEINSSRLKLEVVYYLGPELIQEEFFVGQAQSLARMVGDSIPETLVDAASVLCSVLSKGLTKQILLDGNFTLMLTVMQDGQELLMRKVG